MKATAIAILASVLLNLVPGTAAAAAPAAPALRDGQRDFDWEIGTWDTRLKRLREPLSGKSDWLEYAGVSVIRPMLGRRANLVELEASGAAGTIVGASLRLYQPASAQWTLNFANLADGMLTSPVSGAFHDGVGTFYGIDAVNGRAVFVRFLILPVTGDQWRFEQAYSVDGGTTWETNWIAIDTRRNTAPLPRTTP
jgi:hypothetical protein